MIKDFIDLIKLVFLGKAKRRRRRNSKRIVEPIVKQMRLGNTMKNKDRIESLERENVELKQQLDQIAELLVKLTKEVGTINRDIAHLLPEK